MVVPEFPASSKSAGSLRPRKPAPSIIRDRGALSSSRTLTPRALRQPRVEIQSPVSRGFRTRHRPSVIAPSSRALWVMDLSGGGISSPPMPAGAENTGFMGLIGIYIISKLFYQLKMSELGNCLFLNLPYPFPGNA
ncbi:hypothetical protein ES703_43092 [subsurface metagenome]